MDTNSKHTDPVGLLPKIFSGEATPDEQRLIDNWLAADPANHVEFESFARLWNITSSASTKGEINLNAEWQKLETAITPARVMTFPWKRVLQIAAVVILLSTLTFIGLKTIGPAAIKAPANELLSVYLPDSTAVSLNAGSKLIYRKGFGATHRSLSLKGEAYFEVRKSNVPFVVSAGEASVSVKGTKFNLRAYAGNPGIRVTVTEGTVILYENQNPDKEAIITAGETGTYDKSTLKVGKLTAINLNDVAWKTGIMDFYNTPLAEVGDILSNTYHVSVVIDPILQNCAVTVRFENQDLTSVINVLKSTLDLNISQEDRKISISGKGC